MNIRLLSIIRKEFIQIRRDVRTLAIIVVMPIMQLFLLGYAATTDVKNISLAVWDQNRTVLSRQLLDAFRLRGLLPHQLCGRLGGGVPCADRTGQSTGGSRDPT